MPSYALEDPLPVPASVFPRKLASSLAMNKEVRHWTVTESRDQQAAIPLKSIYWHLPELLALMPAAGFSSLTNVDFYKCRHIQISPHLSGYINNNKNNNNNLLPHTWYMTITDHMGNLFRLPWKMIRVKMIYKYLMSHQVAKSRS